MLVKMAVSMEVIYTGTDVAWFNILNHCIITIGLSIRNSFDSAISCYHSSNIYNKFCLSDPALLKVSASFDM